MRVVLFVLLAGLGVVFVGGWVKGVRSGGPGAAKESPKLPSPLQAVIGFVTNFFDTLGIGSFAPTTSWFKLQNVVPDQRIPGTMHVGHTPPVIVQAFIFIAIIQVDMPSDASARILPSPRFSGPGWGPGSSPTGPGATFR